MKLVEVFCSWGKIVNWIVWYFNKGSALAFHIVDYQRFDKKNNLQNLSYFDNIIWIGEEIIILQKKQMIGQQGRHKHIKSLMKDPTKIRNVSIVAHVDHGKTTLADCLIASNGIIHRKQAGHLRFLDDRLDEQDRGITMKSSSIALLYKQHLINLIDSPGHLDFYSEVSAALRVTDAALLVVDAVEGVSSQTFRVLQQLYTQKLPAILVLNKIDKLITHCQMEPLQAYNHLNQLIQHVNAILGSLISKEVGTQKQKNAYQQINNQQPIDTLQTHFYFSPQKRNVVFSSALDNWGFAIQSFSHLIAKKLNKIPQEIQKYLWGQYYFNPKTKIFSQQPRNDNDKPLCVDWILKPIWDIFQNVEKENQQKLEKTITALNLKISQGARKVKGTALIREILSGWLPLDRILLERIVGELPNPINAQKFRLPYLLDFNLKNQKLSPIIENCLQTCSSKQNAPLIAFISKMITIPRKQINERGLNYGSEGNQTQISIGFGRIFSGTIRRGQQIFVIGIKPKKIALQTGQIVEIPDIVKAQVSGLYYFNGQYPEGVEQAYGGNIVGFGGLQNHIFKSGTISTSQQCISFVPVSEQTKSILKVSVSTPDIKNVPRLLEGLKRLNRSDPSIDIYTQANGDIILNTCGQVHLEKCVTDLQSIYCKVPISTSDPIISFRQTITWLTLSETKNQKYLQQIQKKRAIQKKKEMKAQYQAQKMADAQIDEAEKQKKRAVQQWDHDVQKYESDDLTVQDTRYFMKNKDDQDKQVFLYKKQRQSKRTDHKNRGKMHTKQQFLNLNLKTNLINIKTPNLKLQITIRAIGMPFAIAQYLQKQSQKMIKLFVPHRNMESQHNLDLLNQQRNQLVDQMIEQFNQHHLQQAVKKLIIQKMVCFGTNNAGGTNMLIVKDLKNKSFFQRIRSNTFDNQQSELLISQQLFKILQEYKTTPAQLFTAVKNGFSLACSSGPLANQQMMGVIFIIEHLKVETKLKIQIKPKDKQEQNMDLQSNNYDKNVKSENNEWATDNFGPLAGQVISSIKDGCIEAFLGGGPRLVEPMYLCQLHADQQYYGNIYNQLSKRRTQIISDGLHEISNFFVIKAYLPMLQSHNFCLNILDKTQGTVNAQLGLDTWKIIQQDPFYTPLTAQDIEDNGLDNNSYNQARIILEKNRQKKGLVVSQKTVVAAEKQRTLKKN